MNVSIIQPNTPMYLGNNGQKNKWNNKEVTKMTKFNDYVINVGDDWENLTPFETAATKKKAIVAAETIDAKCVEVVYSPCNNIDVNKIVWRNQKN